MHRTTFLEFGFKLLVINLITAGNAVKIGDRHNNRHKASHKENEWSMVLADITDLERHTATASHLQ